MAKHTKMRLRDDTRLALWIDEPDNEGEPPTLVVLQIEADYGYQCRNMELTLTEAEHLAGVLKGYADVLLRQMTIGRQRPDDPGIDDRVPF